MSWLKQIAKEMAENWLVPTCIIAFLANTLTEKNSGWVIPWKDFRLLITDIVNMRLNYSDQINSFVNSNYLSMEEFLILYFLKTHKLRRLAEINLVNFIASLKYYQSQWAWAWVFAIISGFISIGQVNPTDASPYSCDIFI